MSECVAIIVGAGKGERAGGVTPKQFRPLLGKRVIDWSLEAFSRHPDISRIILVLSEGAEDMFGPFQGKNLVTVTGGPTRAASVAAALTAIDTPDETCVLIHDAARPGLSQNIISQLLMALSSHDAAAPALLVPDAIKDISGPVLQTVNRENLRRIQTPQAFRLDHIRKALDQERDRDWVDDLEAVEAAGATTILIPGEARLSKLTYEEDFDMIARLMLPGIAVPRIGTGYDVHALGEGDHVTLCGIKVPHGQGLIGHSDADVAWHALTDAILGALAEGDIGDHFPPSDPKWKGAASSHFLEHAAKIALTRGYLVAQTDITLICEAPKIKPHRLAMREATANILKLPLGCVSIKATTTEGLGFTGRQEGIAVQASAVLTPLPNLD